MPIIVRLFFGFASLFAAMSIAHDASVHALDIVQELVDDSQFASFDAVCLILADRYDHSPLITALIHSTKSDPAPTILSPLHWLRIINEKVCKFVFLSSLLRSVKQIEIFLEAYSLRPVFRLSELDEEVCQMLDSFLTPTFADMRSSLCDPHEIDLSDDCLSKQSQTSSTSCITSIAAKQHAGRFGRYGIGSILWHRRVRQMISQSPSLNVHSFVKESKDAQQDQQAGLECSALHVDAFRIINPMTNLSTLASLKHMKLLTASLSRPFKDYDQSSSDQTFQPSPAFSRLLKICQFLSSESTSHPRELIRNELDEIIAATFQSTKLDATPQNNESSSRKRARQNDTEIFTLVDISSALADFIIMNSSNTTIAGYGKDRREGSLSHSNSCGEMNIAGIDFNGKLVLESRTCNLNSNIIVIGNEVLRSLLPFPVDPSASKQHSSTSGSTNDLTGRWGEALVFHYLVSSNPESKVLWLNQHAESRASYDITVQSILSADPSSGRTTTTTSFIEVKSTRSMDRNVCEISLYEWQFATSLPKVQVN